MKHDETKTMLLLCLAFSFPVMYLALAAAPYLGAGLGSMLQGMILALEKPNIVFCKDSLKTVLLFLLVYAGSIGVYLSMQKNYRRGAEHGSAKWGNPQAVNRKYMQKPPKQNRLLTQQVRISLDGRKHRRNLNVIVIGGSGAGKTLKSIQLTLAARLEKFNLESLANLTRTDELELSMLGEKKTAIFALIPDNDTSFNFLVSILYTQLFQQLFYLADHKYGGSLPVPVHFLMDEFANVSLPDDFEKALSVMRSRGVSVSIILQNLAQLKKLFEKEWESITGNCDSFLYLGGNEQSTHAYVSKFLGKETIDLNTYGKSAGRNGNYSTNYQISGRELLTPDEVRRLDNRYALLFIRGESPIMDLKYDILKHPNVKKTTDGGEKPFIHGKAAEAIASVLLRYIGNRAEVNEARTLSETDYEVLTEAELEKNYGLEESENE